ncbi:MAG: hypothetical protein HDR21_08430 [Lachnospiraceae bacterium]|nr:hypothetical protein [Lachnospiraceae bacterium]
MNRSILCYPDCAEQLNQRVQKIIAPHLFLFCNYNPTPLAVYSVDARFIKAVLNLYKLLIDSGVVNQVSKISKAAEISFCTRKLREYSAIANTLRTVAGHNLSDLNGTGDEISKYRRWLKSLTGKNEIENEDDYEKPLNKLEEIAEDSMKLLEQFVEEASIAPKKSEMIAVWEQCIIDFYCKATNKSIFMGQLYDTYVATHMNSCRENAGLEYQIAIWIRDTYYRAEETEINNMKNILDVCNNRIDVSVKKQIQEKIDELQRTIDERELGVAQDCNCSMQELRSNVSCYKNHYCHQLRIKLVDALDLIVQNKKATMFPHDIMQQIICKDFHLDRGAN